MFESLGSTYSLIFIMNYVFASAFIASKYAFNAIAQTEWPTSYMKSTCSIARAPGFY